MSSQRPYAHPRRNLVDTRTSLLALWPLIADHYGGGTLESLEDEADLHPLDADAGIDAVQLLPGRQRRTWASRIQFGPVWWGSFSIRHSKPSGRLTEFDKRMHAYREGLLLPDRTLQGYIEGRPPIVTPIAVGTVDTRDLYGFLDGAEFARNRERWAEARTWHQRGDRSAPQNLQLWGFRELRDGTRFLYITWALLAHVGVDVQVHHLRRHQPTLFNEAEVAL